MYVSEISSRFSRGMSTPAIRAMNRLLYPSTLPLLVTRVVTDDTDGPVSADHLALVAHLLDRRSNFHDPLSPSLLGGIPASRPLRTPASSLAALARRVVSNVGYLYR